MKITYMNNNRIDAKDGMDGEDKRIISRPSSSTAVQHMPLALAMTHRTVCKFQCSRWYRLRLARNLNSASASPHSPRRCAQHCVHCALPLCASPLCDRSARAPPAPPHRTVPQSRCSVVPPMSLPTWNGANKRKGNSKARKQAAAAGAAAATASSSSAALSFVPADGYVRVPAPQLSFKGYCAIANLEVTHTLTHARTLTHTAKEHAKAMPLRSTAEHCGALRRGASTAPALCTFCSVLTLCSAPRCVFFLSLCSLSPS